MEALATNRVHGLGMTTEEFWNSTPRELAAHEALLRRDDRMLADVLAALHNGPLIRKDEQHWTSDMFMPGYAAPLKSAESQTAHLYALKGALERKPITPEQAAMQREINYRMTRARQPGLTAEQVNAIMRGVL
jgi:hypothetical protein